MRKHLREWIYSRGQHDRQQKQQGDARYGLDNRLKQHRLLFAQHNCQMQPFLLHRSSNSSSNRSCTRSGADSLTLGGRHSLPGTNCPPGLFSAVRAAAATAAGASAVRQHLQQLLSSPPVAATRRCRFLTASVPVSAIRGGLKRALQPQFFADTQF